MYALETRLVTLLLFLPEVMPAFFADLSVRCVSDEEGPHDNLLLSFPTDCILPHG